MSNIKVGIFGAGRGMNYAKEFLLLGCDVVAVCERRKEVLEKAAQELGPETAMYENFDDFIEHDMDAVFVANNFHEHVPFVIRLFEKGIHVLCECISNATMAEGVQLIRAFEKSNSIYMLAENYPQMLFNREMKRICDTGTLGKILYAEGEYNHPSDPYDVTFKKSINYFPTHWRNFLPRTYYITHSLGPVMRATGANPKRVTAFASFAPVANEIPTLSHVGDQVAIITTLNDDGSIFRITGHASFGGHHNAYRICGTNGQIENVRGMDDQMMLRYNSWNKPAEAKEVTLYTPEWNDKDEEIIKKSGHSGGDYLTARMFIECIKAGKQPEHPFDIHSAVTMSSVGILGHRSMLEGGQPYEIPDFHLEEHRKQYENDTLTPFYGSDGSEPTLPCCSKPDFRPSDEQVAAYMKMIQD